MAEQEQELAPVRQSVDVECPIEDAFDLFTERFSDWWPHLDEDSKTVIACEPPTRVAYEWSNDQRIEVEFQTIAIGTRVTITHTNWHLSAMKAASAFREFACSQLVFA